MSDFGSSIERYGPRFELSGRASKADLRRRIAALEAERDAAIHMATRCADSYAELEAENKKAVYGCCEECRALSEAEAALAERDRMLHWIWENFDEIGPRLDFGTWSADLCAHAEKGNDDE